MKHITALLFFLFICLLSCNLPLFKKAQALPEIETYFLTEADFPVAYGTGSATKPKIKPNTCCRQKSSYIPDTNYLQLTPEQLIRVNFHFINSEDSTRNFNEKDGKEYIRQLMNEAYNRYHDNQAMRLHPPGETTPVLPTRYRYILTPDPNDPADDGIYFHYDNEYCDYITKGKGRNYGKRAVIKKYGVQLDTVLNVFLMSHPPDSIESKTYKAYGHGVALGNAVKITGAYFLKIKPWDMQKHLNHEVGHIFGLRHSWTKSDGCDDTPPNPNCWNESYPKPGCDSLASNNLMGYNVWQSAWTPCQIGIIHHNIQRLKGRGRKYVIPKWCDFNEKGTFSIKGNQVWEGERDLMGNLVIEAGSTLEIKCRTSIPGGGKILVRAGGTLLLNNALVHNSCGKKWLGIEVEKSTEGTGVVEIIGNTQIEKAENWAITPNS